MMLMNQNGYIVTICSALVSVSSAQFNSNPAVSEYNGAATLSWQIPEKGLGSGISFNAISPATKVVFLLTPSGLILPSANYINRTEFNGNYTSRNITFTLRNISSADTGTYMCGNGGTETDQIIPDCGQMLVMLGKPTKPPIPSPSTTPVYMKQVTLTCTSTSTSIPPGHGPALTYAWERDGTIVTPAPGSSFIFTVTSRDPHNYRCRADQSRGLESDWSDVYREEPDYGPYQETLTPPGLSYTVRENQDTVLPIYCTAICKPNCTYSWEKNGKNFSNSAVLNLGQSSKTQTGSYRCRAVNKHGSVYTSSVSVNVQYGARISEFSLNSTAGPVTVSEGETVTLTCQVDSNPPATIKLLNGSQELTRGDNSLSVTSTWQTTCRQRGNYSCSASNLVGPVAISDLNLAVECSPRPDETFPVKYQFASRLESNVTLWMSVLSYPVPTFTWSRSNSSSRDLSGSLSVLSDISVNISLTLTSLQREDFGLYNLTISNGFVEDQDTIFEVVPQGPPDLPINVQVRKITPNSALVSWTAGFNGGDVQHFTATYSTDNTTWMNSSTIEEKELAYHYEIMLSSLNPSTIYTVRVTAGNKFGHSEYTKAVLLETKVDPREKSDNTALIAGVSGGCTALLLLTIGAGGLYLYRRNKGKRDQQSGPSSGRIGHDFVLGENISSGAVGGNGGPQNVATLASTDVYAVVDKKPKPSKVRRDVYAQVKPKKTAKPGDVYENTFLADADARTYANAGFVQDDHTRDETTIVQAPPTGRDADGCLYVGIDFSNQKPGKVIIGKEKGSYVDIAYGKVGPPPPPDEDEEVEEKKNNTRLP